MGIWSQIVGAVLPGAQSAALTSGGGHICCQVAPGTLLARFKR